MSPCPLKGTKQAHSIRHDGHIMDVINGTWTFLIFRISLNIPSVNITMRDVTLFIISMIGSSNNCHNSQNSILLTIHTTIRFNEAEKYLKQSYFAKYSKITTIPQITK